MGPECPDLYQVVDVVAWPSLTKKKESLIVGKIIMCKNTKMKTGTDSLFRGGMTKINKVQ